MALLKFKRSAVPSKIPALTDLELGELAINTYDGKVYMRKDDGTASIIEVGGGGGVLSFNSRTGAVTLTSGDVTGALGYTPYNSSNPAGYITGITSGNVTTALGYTPANKAGDTFTGLVSINGSGVTPAVRLLNSVGGRDYRVWQKDDGRLTITDETAGAERLVIDSSGAMQLSAGGVSNTHQFLYNESGAEIQLSDATGNGPILIDNSGGLARLLKVGSGSMDVGTTGTGFLRFQTADTERARIDSSGNVGIGTSSPGAKLDVAGVIQSKPASGTYGQIILNNQTSGSWKSLLSFHNGATAKWELGVDPANNGTNSLYFWDSAASSTRMLIDSAGNVGIGTSSPGAKLDVAGTNGNVQINAAGDQVSYIYNGYNYLTASGAAATLQIQASGASGKLTFATAGSERFRITSTGGITSSDLADAVGYKGLPQNAQTSSYTLALSDMGKHISITTGGVVIPANASVAFPIGAAISIFNNSGSNQTISITSDTLRQAGTANTGSRTLAQYGIATCVKVGTTTWVISGAGIS